MSFEIAKAGWLHRQSSVLKRWKKNWFVLYTDGMLKYFDSPDNHVAEQAELLAPKLLDLKAGKTVTDVTPPPGFSTECLLMLLFSHKNWTLCAESPDDMRAWQLALEEARVLRHPAQHAPPPYTACGVPAQPYASQVYPGQPYQAQVYNGQPYPIQQTTYYTQQSPAYGGPCVVQQVPAGQTTVIYTDGAPGQRYYGRGYNGGAALGTMMYGPLLWW